MDSSEQYTRDPIVEAILDIQVEPGKASLDSLAKCQQKVKKDYPNATPIQVITSQVSFGQKLSTSTTSEPNGYLFVSEDKKQQFQASLNGYTFNRLSPYPGWIAFFAEAQRLWEEYRRVARPRGYKRVALRYINRFDIPEPTIQIEDYFRTHPQISSDLPQLMAGFFFRLNLPIAEINSVATITETIVPPKTVGQTSIVLDTDLFRTESLPSGDQLWPLFEQLRVWKNKIFESCIMEQTRELIR